MFLWHIHIIVFFFLIFLSLPFFLVIQDVPVSSCIFSVPVLTQLYLQGALLSLLGHGIRKQDLDTMYVHCYYVVVISWPSRLTKQINICVYNNQCIYTYLKTFLYAIICIYVKLNMSSYRCLLL